MYCRLGHGQIQLPYGIVPFNEPEPIKCDDLVLAAGIELIAPECQRLIGNIEYFAGHGMSECRNTFEIVVVRISTVQAGVTARLGTGIDCRDLLIACSRMVCTMKAVITRRPCDRVHGRTNAPASPNTAG